MNLSNTMLIQKREVRNNVHKIFGVRHEYIYFIDKIYIHTYTHIYIHIYVYIDTFTFNNT
jgi:hypothetical protein